MSDLESRIRTLLPRRPILAVLATADAAGVPSCRYVMLSCAEDFTLRCSTFLNTRKVPQIQARPEVSLTCGVASLETAEQWLQISATAQVCSDAAERHAFWNDHMKVYFSGPDDPQYGVIVMKPSAIELWTMTAPVPEVWKP